MNIKSIKNYFKNLITPFGDSNPITYPIVLILVVLFWQLERNLMIPSLVEIAGKFIKIIPSANFLGNLFMSLKLMSFATVIAIVISLLLSYLYKLPSLEGLSILVTKIRFIGYVGVTFIFTILFKESSIIKSSLLVFSIVPFFVASALSLIGSIDPQELELCKTLNMNPWETLYEVVIRGKLDQVLEIIRQNIGVSFMMLTFVESLSDEGGIGMMMVKQNRSPDGLSSIIAILIFLAIFGSLLDSLLISLRKYLFPYVNTKSK